MDLKAHIGEKVKEARGAAGMTQEALAEALGKSARTVSAIESGQSLTSLKTLQEIADSLDRPLAYFFADFDDEPAETRRSKTDIAISALLLTLDAKDKDLALALLRAVQSHNAKTTRWSS